MLNGHLARVISHQVYWYTKKITFGKLARFEVRYTSKHHCKQGCRADLAIYSPPIEISRSLWISYGRVLGIVDTFDLVNIRLQIFQPAQESCAVESTFDFCRTLPTQYRQLSHYLTGGICARRFEWAGSEPEESCIGRLSPISVNSLRY